MKHWGNDTARMGRLDLVSEYRVRDGVDTQQRQTAEAEVLPTPGHQRTRPFFAPAASAALKAPVLSVATPP